MNSEPTVAILLNAIALLIVENDAQRIRLNKVLLCEGKRTYLKDELDRGRDMTPVGVVTPDGNLVLRLES